MNGSSREVPCLYPECRATVRFDLPPSNGTTPRVHARCANGHPHYAEGGTRYGTARERN
jgi:hypothetical protein